MIILFGFRMLISKACLNFTRRISRKAIEISPRHQRNKDEKLMFGGVLETKAEKRKREKQQVEEKLLPVSSKGSRGGRDSEALWLENVSKKDLKIFRKTSSGRYKEINTEKLLEKLNSENEEQKKKKITMPDIIVNKLTSFSMLTSTTTSTPTWTFPEAEKTNFPAVTKILGETLSEGSKLALERWKQKMIQELGEEGFLVFNKEQLSYGARFHNCVRQYLEKCDPVIDKDLEPAWSSVQHVLPDIDAVQLLESMVYHEKLKYKGVIDCVASYRNTPAVIEWKVSEKSKPMLSSTYDAPLQLTAYLGALSNDPDHRMNLRNGLIVVVYKDGSPANVFPMNEQECLKHWSLWLKRLQLFWQAER